MTLFIILSIVTFFDTVFLLILLYLGFKLFFRYFGPKVVEKAADKIYRDLKAQEEVRRRSGSASQGNVTVEKKERNEKTYRRKDGEYVDFEEIK
jgi:hypothetical protein